MSVADRVTAARHVLTGDVLSKAVCKATSHEVISPKKKHVDYLIQCTHERNVDISVMVDTLYERTTNTSWVVVCKTLVTHHQLLCYGNERYLQHVASRTSSFNLDAYLDRSGTQGYDMSMFARRYGKYLNAKSYSYRMMAYDFCRIERGKEGTLRKQDFTKLSKTLPALEQQIDALLGMQISVSELNNAVISGGFFLLFKDLVRLFACYNDAMINLLEKYFELARKNCKEALDFYKKFIVTMEKVKEFWKVAEDHGYDRGDIPYLNNAPASLLDALENHYHGLDKKGARSKAATEEIEKAKENIQNLEILKQRASNLNLPPSAGAANQVRQQPQQQVNLISPSSPVANQPEKPKTSETFEPFGSPANEQPKQQTFDPFGQQPAPNVSQSDPFQQQQQLNAFSPQQQSNAFSSPQQSNNFPPQQQLNTFPPQQQSNTFPPQQQSNTFPPQQQSNTFSPQQQSNAFPQQQSNVFSPQQQSNAFSSPQQSSALASQQQPNAAFMQQQPTAAFMPQQQPITHQSDPFQQQSTTSAMPVTQSTAQKKGDLSELGDLFSSSQPTSSQTNVGNTQWQTQQPQAVAAPAASFNANFNNNAGNTWNQSQDVPTEVMQPIVIGKGKGIDHPKVDDVKLTSDLDSSLAIAAENLTLRNTVAAAGKKSKHQWTPAQPQKLTGGDNYQVRPISSTTSTAQWAPQVGMWNQPQQQASITQPFGQPMGMQPTNQFNPFQQQQPAMPQSQTAPQQAPDPFGL